MSVLDSLDKKEEWEEFLSSKKLNKSISIHEEKIITDIIENEKYNYYISLIKEGKFPTQYPRKILVNKGGTEKKRVVYSFDDTENTIFKFIAYKLYEFDDLFSENCYAFRRGYGVKDAINRLKRNLDYSKKYCFKADISNYFNSIDIDLLLEKLAPVKERDYYLYSLLERVLRENRVYENNVLVTEQHGAMAGTPYSPFLANIYLAALDKEFEKMNIPYFRYSDDILFFADNLEELSNLIELFNLRIKEHNLFVNNSKVKVTNPGECFEFLGFSYDKGVIDLSESTIRKLKAKIKRKSDALRRWSRKKGLSEDKAAIGFIRAMNRKFFGGDDKQWDEDDFTWCRWFFPNITTDKSLKLIDEYMQQYIRYTVTGRHYKGNYRIKYNQLKQWGYKSLVHEYYSWKKR